MLMQRLTARPSGKSSRHARGLSLMETALATVIVGTAVLAIVRLVTAVTTQNFYAQKTTLALTLADNIREVMNGLPFSDPAIGTHLGASGPVTGFNDCEDFAGYLANPPIDANCQPIANLTNWQQAVTVTHVNPSNFQLPDNLPTDSACNLDRIQVVVSYRAPGASTWTPIVTVEWLKSKI